MENWHEKYLGIKFKPGGRTLEGVDCGGLVILIYKDELGVSLRDVGDTFDKKTLLKREGLEHCAWILDESAKGFSRVSDGEALKPFDVIFYEVRGAISHCAIVVADTGFVLHVEATHRSHLERIENLEARGGYRRAGVYRL